MNKLFLVGWLLVPTLIAGCGSDGPAGAGGVGGGGGGGMGVAGGGGAGAAALPDPCTLLSVAEWTPLMEAAPVVAPRSGSAGPVTVTRCDWTHESGMPPTRRQWSNLATAVAGAYAATPMSQPIDIGDEGYILATDMARTVDIGWKKGAASATFKYSALVVPAGKTWPELRDAATALARQAASRMP